MDELAPLSGARLQRLDVVDDRELVFELRVPGGTVRLLVCARPSEARVHLVSARPPRMIPHGPLQAFLRTRLVGQRLARLGLDHRTLVLVFEADTLGLDLRGGKRALSVQRGGELPPAATPWESLPRFSAALAEETPAEDASARRDNRLRDALHRSLGAERRKLERLGKNLERDLDRLSAYAAERGRGELLKTVMHQVKRGDGSVSARDFLTGEEVVITLDPRKSAKANLQRLFDRAKKADRGRPRVEARLEAVWERLEAIDAATTGAKTAQGEDLVALAERAGVSLEGFGSVVGGTAQGQNQRPIDRFARRFTAVDGTEIFVGRGASENDRLTFGFGRGSDLWLHARGSPGAHVLLRPKPGSSASQEALLDAAHLAVHNSPQRGEEKAEVLVAERRHVKKTKGAPPGLVGVAESRTVLVRMEPERIARLYGQGPP